MEGSIKLLWALYFTQQRVGTIPLASLPAGTSYHRPAVTWPDIPNTWGKICSAMFFTSQSFTHSKMLQLVYSVLFNCILYNIDENGILWDSYMYIAKCLVILVLSWSRGVTILADSPKLQLHGIEMLFHRWCFKSNWPCYQQFEAKIQMLIITAYCWVSNEHIV